MTVRRAALLGTLLAVGASLLTGGVADAGGVAAGLRATATCPTRSVPVRLVGGGVATVRHARPGRTITTITGSTSNLFLVVRLHAAWRAVQGGAGSTVELTAAGPDGEAWLWSFRLRSAQPLADPTDYTVCLHPTVGRASFVSHLHGATGAWTFTASVTTGRVAGTTAQLSLVSS